MAPSSTKKRKCQQRKVKKVMGEFKRRKLKTGNGRGTFVVVVKPKQAVAIALSQAGKTCGINRMPKKRKKMKARTK
jgi:hypothetical protein